MVHVWLLLISNAKIWLWGLGSKNYCFTNPIFDEESEKQ